MIPINVLITAGGTYEDIDSVRCITNKATGRLGSIIADTFTKANARVTYICGETAVLPTCDCAEIIRIKNVAELLIMIETLMHTNLYDCVIHSMAVSDFTPQGIISIEEVVEVISSLLQTQSTPCNQMSERIRAAIIQCKKPLTDKKINSKFENVALLLKQTPKVIGRIKSLQPSTILVGFKLLSNVSEEELLQAGQNLLTQNACDFVIANDLTNIKGDMHSAILLDENKILGRAGTKQEIAEMIFNCVSERVANI